MEHTPEEEERINAVLRYLEGERQVDIYRSLERSKFWFNKWMGRYKTGRKDWYKDLPKSATVIPHKTSEQIEQVVVNLRKALTDGTEDATKYSCVGAEAIQFHMEGLGYKPVDIPSISTIKRIIKWNKMTVNKFNAWNLRNETLTAVEPKRMLRADFTADVNRFPLAAGKIHHDLPKRINPLLASLPDFPQLHRPASRPLSRPRRHRQLHSHQSQHPVE